MRRWAAAGLGALSLIGLPLVPMVLARTNLNSNLLRLERRSVDDRLALSQQAVKMLLERLFTIPELQRVWLTTTPENLASQALARKLGFVQEGLLRGHCIVQGRRTDQQVWGLLKPEWEVRRGTLTVR